MNFLNFRDLMQTHLEFMMNKFDILYVTDTDKDELWDMYLDSFPPGTNEVFRERREFDCSCCRSFIKNFGNVVVLDGEKVISIWDFEITSDTFGPVVKALSKYVKSKQIRVLFCSNEGGFGVEKNYEETDNGDILTWNHFYVKIPRKFKNNTSKTVGTIQSDNRSIKEVFKRSLEEITLDSVETVLDLISQKSLYKGEEWESVLKEFHRLHKMYHKLADKNKDNFCWNSSVKVGGSIGKIKNHSIGVLLTDISEEMELNQAVKRYESIVAPTNYKRPKAIFTKKMVEQAKNTLEELGMVDSLGRRHATIDDITVNNILFANKDTMKTLTGDVFDDLKKESKSHINKKSFDRLEEVPVENFVKDILPSATNVEIFVENNHTSNFMSLISPINNESKSLFKWDNNFSWAYNGNITDSMMKDRVKSLGGKVDGVLRFSIQWNDNGENNNDFDAHCIEPNTNEIYYSNKGRVHPSSGMLDVDIMHPNQECKGKSAVENITWSNKDKMLEGTYKFFVHNYSHNGGRTGFSAEIEYDGNIHTFVYDKELRQGEKVQVATITFSKKEGITFIKQLPSTVSSKMVWEIPTQQFHPVSLCMFSPNYWDEQSGIGHRHYFFILKDCNNRETPNGFFNEFLKRDLEEHKRVFEALGSKMKVADSDEQLSGIGFSSTKRNSLVCKVDGSFTRMIKIKF